MEFRRLLVVRNGPMPFFAWKFIFARIFLLILCSQMLIHINLSTAESWEREKKRVKNQRETVKGVSCDRKKERIKQNDSQKRFRENFVFSFWIRVCFPVTGLLSRARCVEFTNK